MIKFILFFVFGFVSSLSYSQAENKVTSVSVVSKNSYLCNLSDCGDIQTLREFNSISQSNNIAPLNTIGVRYQGRFPLERTIKQEYLKKLKILENNLRINIQKIREIEKKVLEKNQRVFELLGTIDISVAKLAGTKAADLWLEIKTLESKIISIQNKNLEIVTLTKNLQSTVIIYMMGTAKEYDGLFLPQEVALEYSSDLILLVNSILEKNSYHSQLEEIEREILERFEVERLQERLTLFVYNIENNQTLLENLFERFNSIFEIYNNENFVYVVNNRVQQIEVWEEIFEFKNEFIKSIFEEAFNKAINDNVEVLLSQLKINSLVHLINIQKIFNVSKKKATLMLAGTLGVKAIAAILFVKEITDSAELIACQSYTENMIETDELCVPKYIIGPKVLNFLGRTDKEIKDDFDTYPELKTYYKKLASMTIEQPSFKSLKCSSDGGFSLRFSTSSSFHNLIRYDGFDTFAFGRRGAQVKTTQEYKIKEIRVWEEQHDVPGMFFLSSNILENSSLSKKEEKHIQKINQSRIFLYEAINCCKNKDDSCVLNFK